MKIPNAHQIKELDALTVQQQDITSLQLMERASSKVTQFIQETYPERDRHIVVFAGPGNNGGDGLAVARQLHGVGYAHIEVFLFNTNNSLSEDCSKNAERLQSECDNVSFTMVTQQFEAPKLGQRTLVVDALFGTGMNKPLSGGYAALTQLVNASKAEVVSIDMPSGLMCEDNSLNSPSSIVRATHTLTFQLPKLSLLLPDTQDYVGSLHLLDIGLTAEGIAQMDADYSIMERAEVKAMLRNRPVFGHKGTFGHALLIAGQYGMAGAAVLASKACLRTGVGKLTVHTPLLNNSIIQLAVPEALVDHDADNKVFTTPVRHVQATAVGIGPGIGTSKRTALALIEQVSHTAVPLVIDADAINILGDHKGWIGQVPQLTVFTPHPGEMQRLGICNPDSFSLLMEAVNMAKQHHFYIVLKGHYTAVCQPDGKVSFCTRGNSGMATAGSGDVLTGVITSLLAQGYTQHEACFLGVYLHGMAGDIAARELGEDSVMASDIIGALPKAIRALREE